MLNKPTIAGEKMNPNPKWSGWSLIGKHLYGRWEYTKPNGGYLSFGVTAPKNASPLQLKAAMSKAHRSVLKYIMRGG